MSNLEDYNRHKTLGPAAGPPTSIGAVMGQRDHMHQHNGPPAQHAAGPPLGLYGWLDSLPRWFVARPIRWGLGVTLACQLLAMAPLPAVLRAAAGLGALFGAAWLIVGLIAYIARRRNR